MTKTANVATIAIYILYMKFCKTQQEERICIGLYLNQYVNLYYKITNGMIYISKVNCNCN